GGGHDPDEDQCAERAENRPHESGPHFFLPPFFPLCLHCPRSLVVKEAPMLFWPSALTVASGGATQMFAELTRRPLLPPSRVITKRLIGASGTPLKSAPIPCFAGPICPSSSIRTAPLWRDATRSGSLCSDERRRTGPRSGSSNKGV